MTKEQKRILIIGEHPIIPHILGQFGSEDYIVTQSKEFTEDSLLTVWNNIFVLSEPSGITSENDAKAIGVVDRIYAKQKERSECRPTVHLLLQNQETMTLLNRREYNDDWHKTFELDAFTMEDVWAKNVVCADSNKGKMRGLDYRPITLDSNKTVHLVVFGISNLALAIVRNSALVAHYPNYTRDHSLRTRITVIDKDIKEWSKAFVCQYKALMDNSYYRTIDVPKRKSELHRPMYEGNREDFVDVEWEFVCGTLHDTVVMDKLQGWAGEENQVLSVALCHDDDTRNLSEATLIVDLLCSQKVPVYVKQGTSAMRNIISQFPRMRNVVMIGMKDCGYDVNLPLLKMAKRVNSVYEYCYNNNIASQTEGCVTAPSYIDDRDADICWLNVRKAIKRYSNICNAMVLATKMRSLGHSADDAETFYAITKQEIDVIAEVEHNRWNVEELLLGFRPCTDEEQADIEADISKKGEYKNRLVHYDLRAYNDLRPDNTGKNVNTYDICLSASIPLIAYRGEKGDGA